MGEKSAKQLRHLSTLAKPMQWPSTALKNTSAGVNFMRQKLRGKLHLSEFLKTLIETFRRVFGQAYVSSQV